VRNRGAQWRVVLFAAVGAVSLAGGARAQQTPPVEHAREVKWVRDSEEYATITRWIYRSAAASVRQQVARLSRGQAWAVVLDVDETALDNTAYELERRGYGQPHDEAVFAAWIARREAGAVPGAPEFIAEVRRLGGRVAWITNRLEGTRVPTQENLALRGLWSDGDRLCMMNLADSAYTKGARRAEVAAGTGACGFGQPLTVLAFVGDQLGDVPRAGEPDADAGRDEAFGVRYFLLPNPMYGGWDRRPNRRR
jgi:5'-nucleotidase (lipoprotein e(P4) family)